MPPFTAEVLIIEPTYPRTKLNMISIECATCHTVSVPKLDSSEGLWKITKNLYCSVTFLEKANGFRQQKVLAWSSILSGISADFDDFSKRQVENNKHLMWRQFLKFQEVVHPAEIQFFRCKCPGGIPSKVGSDGVNIGPHFSCGKCHDLPHSLVDGVVKPQAAKERYVINFSDQNKPLRKLLIQSYSSTGVSPADRQTIQTTVRLSHPSLCVLIDDCQWQSAGTNWKLLPEAATLIRAIASVAPITTFLTQDALDCFRDLPPLNAISVDDVISLKDSAPRLFEFFHSTMALPLADPAAIAQFCNGFRQLCVRLQNVFLAWMNPHVSLPAAAAAAAAAADLGADDGKRDDNQVEDYFRYGQYFPFLPRQRVQKVYDTGRDGTQTCAKQPNQASKSGNRVLMIFICLDCHVRFGFSCVDGSETPKAIFDVIFNRFPTAPEYIVYDNACNACVYAMLREPLFFAKTKWVVDRFHSYNHKVGHCSPMHHADRYRDLFGQNTSIMEQTNAIIRHDSLGSQLQYMNASTHFICTCQILSHINRNLS